MVRRHAETSFGASYVFPGGVLEDQDGHVHEFCNGVTEGQARALLETDDALDYFSSAIRELFEEAGVLLADTDMTQSELASARASLNDGSLGWYEFVNRHALRLDCGELTYFSFWITPDVRPKRYSTRFFLAELPDGQEAVHCGLELIESVWMTAKDILAAFRADKMVMQFPTLSTVKKLAQFASIADIRNWCASRQAEGVPCVQPKVVDGRPVLQ